MDLGELRAERRCRHDGNVFVGTAYLFARAGQENGIHAGHLVQEARDFAGNLLVP